MKEKWQGSLFYVVLIAGLVSGSFVFTGQIEAPEIELPSLTATPMTPTEVAQNDCLFHEERINLGYIAGATAGIGRALMISGTVYAADMVTPLADVLIESWVLPLESQSAAAYLPYTGRHFHSNAAGHYELLLPKPGQDALILLNYRPSYQDYCPLRARLFLVDAPAPNHALPISAYMKTVPHAPLPMLPAALGKVGLVRSEPGELPPVSLLVLGQASAAQMEKGGSLLHGPLDVFLAVAPPQPYH